MKRYLIITPAHNEEAFIEKTIQSVVRQTVPPVKWIVVNDASKDRTGAIISDYARATPFIEVVTVERPKGRHFGNKVTAFNRGLERSRGLDYDFIGNLDADISFEPEYFENILNEFEKDPGLGLSGGIVYTKFSKSFVTFDNTLDSVGGKVQLFRRKCFEDIGGYLPLEHGGIDAAAEVMTRMKGWKVRKSLSNKVLEHRPTGFARGRPLKTMLHDGRKFRLLGYGPLFYGMRCVYRLRDYPFVVGSLTAFAGYIWSMIRRERTVLPAEVVDYLRSEQRLKIRQKFGFS
jgi:biofilm PGA synthesis N-glycosyltransferase PgaC